MGYLMACLLYTSDVALNNGAQGIAVFTIHGLCSPEVKRQFKAYTDSVRAVRAANGGVIKATHPEVADPDRCV